MAYTSDHPHFTVTVTSGFIEGRQWEVQASVEFRTLGLVGIRKAIEAEARLEMMIGISRESRLGRDCGASSIVVVALGDPEVLALLPELGRSDETRQVA